MGFAYLAHPMGELAYRVKGAGPRVLLMHAGIFGAWFEPLWDEPGLSRLEVIDYRRLGYAPSARPERVLSIAEHAEHAASLLDHLAGASATVVGHSSAALMALDLAFGRPDLVNGLVLVEPAFTDVPAHAALGAQVVGPAIGRFKAGDVTGAFEVFMAGVCGESWQAVFDARLGPGARAHAVLDAAWFFRYETPAILGWRPEPDQLAQLTCPIALLGGARSDQVHPVFGEQVRRAAELLPCARVACLPGTHMAPLEYPRDLANHIASFAAAISAGAGSAVAGGRP